MWYLVGLSVQMSCISAEGSVRTEWLVRNAVAARDRQDRRECEVEQYGWRQCSRCSQSIVGEESRRLEVIVVNGTRPRVHLPKGAMVVKVVFLGRRFSFSRLLGHRLGGNY